MKRILFVLAWWGITWSTATASPDPLPPDDPFASCHGRIEAEPDDWRGYNCVYVAARTQGLYEEAVALLEAIVQRHPDRHWAKSYLASHYADLGDDRAEAMYRDALAAFEELGDAENEVYTHLSLADLLSRRDFAAVRTELRAAAEAADRSENPQLQALAQVELARQIWRERGDLVEALRLSRKTAGILSQAEAYALRLTALHVQAGILADIGREAEAIALRREQLALSEQRDDPLGQATALLILAEESAYGDATDDLEPPATLARRALTLGRDAGIPLIEAQAHCMLGNLRHDDPRVHYEQCQDKAGTDLITLRQAKEGLALLTLETDPAAAFDHADAAIRLARERGADPTDAHLNRVVMRWQAGPRAQAIADSLALLDEHERVIARQKNALGRAQFVDASAPSFYFVAHQILATSSGASDDDVDLATSLIERMRTRVLVEQLDRAEVLRASAHGPVWDAHEQTAQTISLIQRRLLEDELEPPERAQVLAELEDAEHEASALWDAIVDSTPGLAELRGGPPVRLAQVQAALEPDQALLSFQLSVPIELAEPSLRPVPSWLLVITAERTAVYALPDRDELEALVTLFTGLFEAREGLETVTATGLYEQLLGPALAELPPSIRELVIVPDASLHRLPFAALRESPSSPPISTRYSLTLVPSIRLWTRLDAQSRRPPSGGIVLADPAVAGQLVSTASPVRAWELATGEPLGPLPYARREATSFVEYLGPRSHARVGDEATETFVKRGGLSGHAVIHFAAHALLDETHPERAAVMLSPGSPDEDGLLQMREIARLDLRGSAVVLAGCRSASGTVVGGEGPIGLARAFFLAGARTVVASLWRIRDDEAAAFFDAFYRYLADGRSVTQAVRAAQNERRLAGAPAAAWAGFVVLGDGDFTPVADQSTHAWPLAFGALAAIVLVGFLIARFGRASS